MKENKQTRLLPSWAAEFEQILDAVKKIKDNLSKNDRQEEMTKRLYRSDDANDLCEGDFS